MIKRKFPVIFIILITCLVFYKIFLKGLFPFPGDALVSQNFPWYSGGWTGYDSWTVNKGAGALDAIRQHLSWHRFTFEYIKENLAIPLWNPYNYSGVPHTANIQTFIFNPFNIFFLFLPLFPAWIIFIVLQFPLAVFFTYIFSRSLGLSKVASLFVGISFIFSSYFIFWFEIGIVGYSVMWLPLMLYSIQNILSSFKIRYLFLLVFASCVSVFSGHIQIVIINFFISFAFWIFKSSSSNKETRLKSIYLFFIWLLSTLFIASIQTIPTLELYLNSPLIKSFSREIFNTQTMPFVNILTLLAPDFFGNPVTNNLWTVEYGASTPNIGVLPLIFSVFALFSFRKKEVKFFLILTLLFILFATKSPIYLAIRQLQIPVLTGTSPVRTMFGFCFGLSILAGYGFDSYLKTKKVNNKIYWLLFAFLVLYLVILTSTFLIPLFVNNKEIWLVNLSISRRNLIIPFFCLFIFTVFVLFKNKFFKNKTNMLNLETWIVIIITLLAGIYQLNKTLSFSKSKNFFPTHPLIAWLQDNASINRFYGQGTSRFDNNYATYYRIYSAEGYSVFRITRYAELIASQETGSVPTSYNRADADFSTKNNLNKRRLFDLIGLKYLIAKDDLERDARFYDPDKPQDDVSLVWQRGKFKIYERNNVLPRFFLTSEFIVAKDDQEILDKIYDYDFDQHTIILEDTPKTAPVSSPADSVELLKYKPDEVVFKTKTENNTLLFLSDAFYPGWEVRVNNIKTDIYRADYAFRAVEVPQGEHVISFNFHPKTFYYGMNISLIGFIAILASLVVSLKKKIF